MVALAEILCLILLNAFCFSVYRQWRVTRSEIERPLQSSAPVREGRGD